jgi:hypothetical protein
LVPAAGHASKNLVLTVRLPMAAARTRWEFGMTLSNLALWLVLIGLLVVIPIGCVLTRQPKRDALPGTK